MWSQCTKCKKYKNLYFFHKDKKGKFGIKSECSECSKKKSREYYRNNKESHNISTQKWKKNNPEKQKEYNKKRSGKKKKWRKDNKEHLQEYFKEYYKNNRDEKIRYQKEWKKNNPEKVKEYSRKYYLLKFNSEGWHTPEEWDELKKYYNYRCLCCGGVEGELDDNGEIIKLTRDHIIPLSEGGYDYIDNIQPLCHSCNCSKKAKTIDYRPTTTLDDYYQNPHPEKFITT